MAVNDDRELAYRVVDRVNVSELTASLIRSTVLLGVTVDAYAYDGQNPTRRIRIPIREGDRVRIEQLVLTGIPRGL
jgi:hypothetical protein